MVVLSAAAAAGSAFHSPVAPLGFTVIHALNSVSASPLSNEVSYAPKEFTLGGGIDDDGSGGRSTSQLSQLASEAR
jgi:hypothetical protein